MKRSRVGHHRKLIAIVGANASGKSGLGIFLAKKFNGEVISADSRQVYKGLDIGSGKITQKEQREIPHHLLDVASPRRRFTVSQYQKLTYKAMENIHKKGSVPFLVGGSPFYVYAVCDGLVVPEVKPNSAMRQELEKQSAQELYKKLQALDPTRATTIETQNKRRLIRALEIVLTTGQPVPLPHSVPLPYPVLFLGIRHKEETLFERIHSRLIQRMKRGMVAEVASLHKKGVSWKRLEELGLEYRWVARFLQAKISKEAMAKALEQDIRNFAKRQMRWFGKDKRIHWVSSPQEAHALTKTFLTP
ncbi:MAG: tRNA (adenosine(37)-N6)-dimethylallyltransferase MiaA [bacterium]|nr:tRNA (adenosine(37)-N6)-dimethylallyltransferase MiaA [bacterium]